MFKYLRILHKISFILYILMYQNVRIFTDFTKISEQVY